MTSSTPGDPAPDQQPAHQDPAQAQGQQPAAQAGPAAQPPVPQWARAQPVVMQTVETEPLEYHRLLRGTPNYRWWKPLLLLLISGVYFGIMTVIVALLSVPLIMAFDPSYIDDVATGSAEILDTQRPVSVFIAMTSIIVMIPAVTLGMLTMGMRPAGRIWSVATRMRWGFLGKLMGAAVLAVIVMNAVGIAADMVLSPANASAPLAVDAADYAWQPAVISMVLVILLVPFQATAEEVVFRGLFMQVLGSWFKTPWVAILLPSIGFALAHIYDIWGLAAVGLMGGVAAWLTWRTGGLEAAIAIHVVNNIVAFGFMAAGLGGSTAQVEASGGPGGVVGEIAGLGTFIWLALIIFKRDRHGRERIDLIQRPVAVMPFAQPIQVERPENGPQHV